MFGSRGDAVRYYWVRYGEEATGSRVSAGIKLWGEGKTNEKAWLQVRLGIINYLLLFSKSD